MRKETYEYFRDDFNLELHKLSRKPEKKKQTLLSKVYGCILLIIFAISVSMLDSVSFIPTLVLMATIILGTIYLYIGGHLDGY